MGRSPRRSLLVCVGTCCRRVQRSRKGNEGRTSVAWRALHAWPDGGGGGSGGGGGAEALVYSGAHLPCFPFGLLLQPCCFTERDLIFTYFSRALLRRSAPGVSPSYRLQTTFSQLLPSVFSCGHDLPVHWPWLPRCPAPAVPGRAAHPRDKGKQVPSPSASLKGVYRLLERAFGFTFVNHGVRGSFPPPTLPPPLS